MPMRRDSGEGPGWCWAPEEWGAPGVGTARCCVGSGCGTAHGTATESPLPTALAPSLAAARASPGAVTERRAGGARAAWVSRKKCNA